jgi:hypothetical protein
MQIVGARLQAIRGNDRLQAGSYNDHLTTSCLRVKVEYFKKKWQRGFSF